MNYNPVDYGPETSDPRELIKNNLRVELRDQRIKVNSQEENKKKKNRLKSYTEYLSKILSPRDDPKWIHLCDG